MKNFIEQWRSLNTIYIISKGRPWCKTAATLRDMGYKGQWFIVCGTNDETIDEYKKNWGERVLVFDWHEEIKHTDTLDNFGFENMPSGAVPVRNATIEISKDRGELRHWQFDDDYTDFRLVNSDIRKASSLRDKPLVFEYWLTRIAYYGYVNNMSNIGFCQPSDFFPKDSLGSPTHRVFNAHNQSSTGLATRWCSRLNDDLINALETWRTGGKELSFRFMTCCMASTQAEAGGLQDIYQAVGTVRKTAYAVLKHPSAVKLKIKFGRYHHEVNWAIVNPKFVSSKYQKL